MYQVLQSMILVLLCISCNAQTPYRLVPPGLNSVDVDLSGTADIIGTVSTIGVTIQIKYIESPTNSGVQQYFYSISLAAAGSASTRQDWSYRNGSDGEGYTILNGAACAYDSGKIINICGDWVSLGTDTVSTYSTTRWEQNCTQPSNSTTDIWVDADGKTIRQATQLSAVSGFTVFATVTPTRQTFSPTITLPTECTAAKATTSGSTPPPSSGSSTTGGTVPPPPSVVNCVYSWGSWSVCSALCGGGTQSRIPTITTAESNGGQPCPNAQTQDCNTGTCTVATLDCQYSWNDWSECDSSCGAGNQYRVATIVQASANGGLACPLPQNRTCNGTHCAIDCTYSWGDWSLCTVACGGGTRSRVATVTQPSSNGGLGCPGPQSEICNNGQCTNQSIACVYSWGSWSACSVTCGSGTQYRYPLVSVPSANNGAPCPESSSRACTLDPCPVAVDCVYTWGDWSLCTANCGGGYQTRVPIVTTSPANGGAACPAPETINCNSLACVANQDCLWDWSPWGNCSVSCGNGTQTRSVIIKTSASGTGAACPSTLNESSTCSLGSCDADCVYTWSNWTECSASCGGGWQYRQPVVSKEPTGSGQSCPASESRTCNTGTCTLVVQACEYSWSPFSDCTTTCGPGTKTRYPIITQAAANNGSSCPTYETVNCTNSPCPVVQNCVYSWNSWGACSAECGGGTQNRDPNVTIAAANGGTSCPVTTARTCNTGACTAAQINCTFTWSPWSNCSATCGPGTKSRNPIVTQSEANGGTPCPTGETSSCNLGTCSGTEPAQDCVFTWGPWTNCSAECGGGYRYQTPIIIVATANGGKACPTTQNETCNVGACVTANQDCNYTWSSWTECSSSCGPANMTRSPIVTTPAANEGKACPLPQIAACTNSPCPQNQDCVYTWSSWTTCSVECGGGSQTRSPTISTPAANAGLACPSIESQSCNTGACVTVVTNCNFTWGDWSPCQGSCDTGFSERFATIYQPAANGGKACPAPENQTCTLPPCNANCTFTWQSWSACTVTCGSGTRVRTPKISSPPFGSGTPCPASESESCNTQACVSTPVDCVYTWGPWSACTASCGPATSTRIPIVTTLPANNGAACPSPQQVDCNNTACGIDCVYTWTGWSTCSAECGTGSQARQISITTPANGTGKACPAPQETQLCNIGACTVVNQDCSYTWGSWSECSTSCGTGTQYRVISINVQSANGGTPCPNTTIQAMNCTVSACQSPVACQYSWTTWGTCSVQCGGGVQVRVANVTRGSAFGGAACPAPATSSCNTGICTVDDVNCQFTWPTSWSTCTASCGGGTQFKQVNITQAAANKGVACPDPGTQTQACNTGTCTGVPPSSTTSSGTTSVSAPTDLVDNTVAGLDLMWWVIIGFVVIVFILVCATASVFFMGSPDR